MSECLDCKLLAERLAYFQTRSQGLLDLVAKSLKEAIVESPNNASLLNVATRFLKDQGIIDLRSGDTPVNHLVKNYRFPAPGEPEDPDVGVKNHG